MGGKPSQRANQGSQQREPQQKFGHGQRLGGFLMVRRHGAGDGFRLVPALLRGNPFIVGAAALGVGKHLIRAVDQAHDAVCIGIVAVLVGMVFFAEQTIRRADSLYRGIRRHFQIIVVGAYAFGHKSLHGLKRKADYSKSRLKRSDGLSLD